MRAVRHVLHAASILGSAPRFSLSGSPRREAIGAAQRRVCAVPVATRIRESVRSDSAQRESLRLTEEEAKHDVRDYRCD